MPVSQKSFDKIVSKLHLKTRQVLRTGLSELLKFDEVLYECERFEQRVDILVEEKRSQNYSQGYYFSIGLLKQLY